MARDNAHVAEQQGSPGLSTVSNKGGTSCGAYLAMGHSPRSPNAHPSSALQCTVRQAVKNRWGVSRTTTYHLRRFSGPAPID